MRSRKKKYKYIEWTSEEFTEGFNEIVAGMEGCRGV